MERGAIKPDIIVWDHENKTAKIIEVSVPNNFGHQKEEKVQISGFEKRPPKLDDIEIIPIIIGATGIVKDNFVRNRAVNSAASWHPRCMKIIWNAN